MPKQAYALEVGGEKRLEISWKGTWQNTTITLDGSSVGTIADQKALTSGQEFRLMDGTTLKIQLVKKFASTELQILRNGEALPGTASDPQTKLKSAYSMVYFVAGLNLVLGAIATFLNVSFLQSIGIGVGSILFGLVFLVLGFFTQRKSTIALILAIGLFGLDGIVGFFMFAMQGHNSNVGGIMARIFLMIPMIQGIDAIKMLNKKKA